jgi:hypothetical protein
MGNIVIGVVVEDTTGAVGALSAVGSAIRNASNTARDAVGGLTQLSGSITTAGEKAQTAGSKFSSFASGLKNQAGAIASVVGSGFLLFNMYDQVTDAQLRADKASTALARSNLQVERAQSSLAAAIAKFGAGSQQAATAQDALNVALSRQKNAAESARDAQQGLGQAMGAFATNVVPALTTSVGSVVQVLSNLKNVNLSSTFSNIASAISGAAQRLPFLTTSLGSVGSAMAALRNVSLSDVFAKIGSAASGAIGGLRAFAEALGGILLRNPALIAAMVAISAVFILLKTNAGGVTDSLNKLGESLGKQAPALRPALDFLHQLAVTLGITGSQAKQTGEAMGAVGDGAAGSAPGVNTLSDAISQMGKEQIAAKAEAQALWSSIQQGAAAGSLSLRNLDVSSLEEKLPKGAQASKAAIEQVQQAVNAYNQEFAKTHSVVAANQAAQAAFNETLQGTSQATGSADEGLARYLSTLSHGKEIAIGAFGAIAAPKTLSDLHLLNNGLSEVSNTLSGLPASKTITIDVKTPQNLAEVTRQVNDFSKASRAMPATAGTKVNIDVPKEPKKDLDPIQNALNVLVQSINNLKNIKITLPTIPAIKIPKVELPPLPSGSDIAKWGADVLNAIKDFFAGKQQTAEAKVSVKPEVPAGSGEAALSKLEQDIAKGKPAEAPVIPKLVVDTGFAASALQALKSQFITPLQQPITMNVTANTGPAVSALTQLQNQLSAMRGSTANGVTINVTANTGPAVSALAQIQNQLAAMRGSTANGVTITVTANTGPAASALAALGQFFAPLRQPVVITVTANTGPAASALASLVAIRPVVTVVFTADFSAVGSAVASIAAIRPIVTILVTADTSQASSALNALASIRIPPSEVVVFADTSEAVSAINQVESSLHALPRIVNVQLTVGGAGGVFMISQLVANIASSKISAFVASIRPVAHSSLVEAGGKLWNPIELAMLLNSARGGTYVTNQSGANMVSANTNANNNNNNHYLSAAKGGSFIVDQPTRMGNLLVGEGYKPELITYIPLPGVNPDAAGMLIVTPLTGKNNTKGMASGGTAMIGNNNILSGLLGGNADGGNGGSGESNTKFDKLISLLEKLVALQAHGGGVPIEATLKVDGMKMASVAQKYIGSKSYGDL